MSDRDELDELILPVLEKCFSSDWNMTYSEMITDAILAAGYAKRETVTEWAAAFLRTGNVYNFHRTREEAQACVDGFREAGAEMVVMTREVLPQDASAWRAAQ